MGTTFAVSQMINTDVGQTFQLDCAKEEIDLYPCLEVPFRRKKAFIGVFLFIFCVGVGSILLSPKIYKVSILLQLPVNDRRFSGLKELGSAESLKGAILSNVFNDALIKRMHLNDDFKLPKFNAVIRNKTNIIQVSVDVGEKEKDFGVWILPNLAEMIVQDYNHRIDAEVLKVKMWMEFYNRTVDIINGKRANLQEQIKKNSGQEKWLNAEKKRVDLNMAYKFGKSGDDNSLSLGGYIKRNVSYIDWINQQLAGLPQRKADLVLKLQYINNQIDKHYPNLEKLTFNKDSVNYFHVISRPSISTYFIRPDKKKDLSLILVIGIFLGMLVVFLQELRAGRLKKINLSGN